VKKVPCIDPSTGERIEQEAVKLETFIFDALPLAGSSIVLETDRAEEFAPIKNRKGSDSPETSHQLQSDRFGRWLEAQNVTVPHNDEGRVDARIEISPLTALGPEDLGGIDLPAQIAPGDEVVL
jgi:UDP-N-acetylglucosamine/UDP-N-acetylgalactosamine diphosphorylase